MGKHIWNTKPCVLIVLAGKGEIRSGSSAVKLAPYDRILIPAAQEECSLSGELELLAVLPPEV